MSLRSTFTKETLNKLLRARIAASRARPLLAYPFDMSRRSLRGSLHTIFHVLQGIESRSPLAGHFGLLATLVQRFQNPLFVCLLFLTCFSSGAFAESIEKAIMPGQVVQGHAKYELECNKCHQLLDKSAQPRLCKDCHKEIAKDIISKSGLHGHQEDTNCRNCHTEHKGRSAKLSKIDKDKFDHDSTDFHLNGAHKEIRSKCESCHKPKTKFREVPQLCNDCHKKVDFEKGHKGKLGTKCESCHSEKNWKETKFDHEKTKFPLLGGKHAEVKCSACHTDKTYQQTPLTCNGCHKKDDQEHGHKGRYGTKCESCHTDQGWKKISFDHDKGTHYPLRGKHEQVKCNSCHLPEKGLLYQQKLPSKCVACHKKDDQEKGHRGSLSEKCESCHDERSWKTTSFDHDKTKFPLHDKHKDAKCESCHKGGFSGANTKLKLEKECVACHKKDDQEKGHKGRYGNKCENCHNEKNWKSTSKFEHDHDTKYLLNGKHRQVKCDACHLPEKGLLYQKEKLESECVSCHKKDDKHKGQLGNKCESCHNEKRWQNAPYDHAKSRFPLTGSHIKTECKKCHVTLAFRDAPSTCNGCHKKEDTHKGRFGTQCETCHYTGTWKSWDFDHDKTRFKLDGAHIKVECYACHKEPVAGRATIGRTCVSCHSKDDVHDGGFSAQCERCHVTSNWRKVRR